MHRHRTHRRPGWILALCLLLSWGAAPAGTPGLDVAAANATPVLLAPHFSVLVDADRSLMLDDVLQPAQQQRFVPTTDTAGVLNRGFSPAALWLRLVLRNDSGAAVERVLDVNFPVLSHIDFHQPAANGGWRTTSLGAAVPFSARPYPSRLFVFPVSLPAHSNQTFYLRVQSHNGILVPATLWEPQAFRIDERNEYLVQSAYFGLAAALVLY